MSGGGGGGGGGVAYLQTRHHLRLHVNAVFDGSTLTY